MSLESALLYSIGIVGLLWYYVCLYRVGWHPQPAGVPPSGLYTFMSFSITSIAATLATFVGMLLGLQNVSKDVNDNVKEPSQRLEQKLQGMNGQGAADAAQQVSANANQIAARTQSSWMQLAAAGGYLLSLLFALGCWARSGDATDPTVVNLGRSLLGLLVGALTVLLNVKAG